MTKKWTNDQLWLRFKKYYTEYPSLHLAMDISRMNFGDDFLANMEPRLQQAFSAMAALEKGAIANPDEERMVGHYWLRNPQKAPTDKIRSEIQDNVIQIKSFVAEVKSGAIKGSHGAFKNLLIIGIGGSALGPQFVYQALSNPEQRLLKTWFFDNTDPDGMDRVLAELRPELGQTLCIVISKSGGTMETRNGMLEAKAAYEQAGLSFEKHAVAITMAGSKLDQLAQSHNNEPEQWLKRFPMWDWVGGRTSELSAVGLLPAALQGIDISYIIDGAKACDEVTSKNNVKENPAAQLALMWYYSGNGKGLKDMVILPYKDRLELFSKYLQQLIMESLGKELFINDTIEHQGIAVYGNKGSTDQHAYVQQLRDGIPNFFVTFIEVLKDRNGTNIVVDIDRPNVTTGDYLNGYLHGTRQALFEKDRESITITIDEVTPFTIGVLIALYERAVGFYASLVHINAYHQPGVEAGKKAAEGIIKLKLKVIDHLKKTKDKAFRAEQIADAIEATDQVENVFKICRHLSANEDRGIRMDAGITPTQAKFKAV